MFPANSNFWQLGNYQQYLKLGEYRRPLIFRFFSNLATFLRLLNIWKKTFKKCTLLGAKSHALPILSIQSQKNNTVGVHCLCTVPIEILRLLSRLDTHTQSGRAGEQSGREKEWRGHTGERERQGASRTMKRPVCLLYPNFFSILHLHLLLLLSVHPTDRLTCFNEWCGKTKNERKGFGREKRKRDSEWKRGFERKKKKLKQEHLATPEGGRELKWEPSGKRRRVVRRSVRELGWPIVMKFGLITQIWGGMVLGFFGLNICSWFTIRCRQKLAKLDQDYVQTREVRQFLRFASSANLPHIPGLDYSNFCQTSILWFFGLGLSLDQTWPKVC